MMRVMERVIGFYGDVCEEKREILLNQWMKPVEIFTVDAILESLRK